jgi:tetraacyldisaccharide 4'-kinase
MKKTLARWVEDVWYKDPFIGAWLMPLGFLFSDVARFRKFLYRRGVLKVHKLPVPVIVVGNITVGGTGKTPFIIWLARLLKEAGYRPGIISRGYGGQAESWPQWVDSQTDVTKVGDEAMVIAKHAACPLAVGPVRVDAAKLLLQQSDCNVILSDDGLQHYALARDIEIAVIDGDRRFGNGYCLPAGPLREPINRLESVDFRIVNGEQTEDNEVSMQLIGEQTVNLADGEHRSLQAFNGVRCHAVAGIGNPDRFFNMLTKAGLSCENHSFPDHYRFQRRDIEFGDDAPVLMTEKDAVKCAAFAGKQHWVVPVAAVLAPGFSEQLLNLLGKKKHG